MTYRLWSVRGALPSIFSDAVAALPFKVEVFDGPRPRGASPQLFVSVGTDGGVFDDHGDSNEATEAHQDWSSLGPGPWRDESGAVTCTAVAWHGETTFPELRTQLEAMLDACSAAVTADPTLGGVLGGDEKADVTGVRLGELQSKNGAAAAATFTVSYQSVVQD